ncbi:MAG: alkaline phosphatase family protein [Proteobacteria bacterium]|nr:alkaline phosphatase family protein [Pseudomonadota bacterium]
MPSWTFVRDSTLLDGGIARLIDSGVYFSTAEFPYSTTFTAPGHAALGTGAPPARTQILGNFWYEPSSQKTVSAIDDPASPVFRVVGQGDPDGTGAGHSAGSGQRISGVRLRVGGIAEALRDATGGAGKSISVGLKARGAVFALGRRPDLAIWYDSSQPAMTTSRYYTRNLPIWLHDLAAKHPVEPRFQFIWTPLASTDHRRVTGIADEAAGEGPDYGLGISFPHAIFESPNPAKALRATPIGDDLVIEAALAAIVGESLGTDDIPDVVALNLSSHDYAGHYWGQESWERLDLFLRLDRKLAVFLSELDRLVGRGGYAVVLTSDHGATRLVEHSRAAGRPAHRVQVTHIAKIANRAASAVLGEGAWIAHTSSSSISMVPVFATLSAASREAAVEAIARAVLAIPGIDYAVPTERIAGQCDRRRGMDAFACNSVVPGLSGEVFFAPAPNSLVTTVYHTGTTHGSPNPDDRTVPVVIMAPGWDPAVVHEPVSTLQIAPTITDLLQIPPPEEATAPPLYP